MDAGSRVLSPAKTITPRDDVARDGQKDWMKLDAPTHGYAEKC